MQRGGAASTGRRSSSNASFELKAHILQVVSRCLDEVPLEKLTISMICQRAQISRPTFYRHFEDRYDVFNWFLRTTMRSSIAQVGIVFTWEDALTRFCRDMEANRDLASKYLASHAAFSSYEKFVGYVQDALRKSARLRFEADDLPLAIRFQIIAFSRAFVASFADWLDGDESHGISMDEYVACVLSIVPSDLFDLLNRSVQGERFSAARLRSEDKSPLIAYVAEEFPTDL